MNPGTRSAASKVTWPVTKPPEGDLRLLEYSYLTWAAHPDCEPAASSTAVVNITNNRMTPRERHPKNLFMKSFLLLADGFSFRLLLPRNQTSCPLVQHFELLLKPTFPHARYRNARW